MDDDKTISTFPWLNKLAIDMFECYDVPIEDTLRRYRRLDSMIEPVIVPESVSSSSLGSVAIATSWVPDKIYFCLHCNEPEDVCECEHVTDTCPSCHKSDTECDCYFPCPGCDHCLKDEQCLK